MNHEHWTEKKTVASKLRIELKIALAQRDALVEAAGRAAEIIRRHNGYDNPNGTTYRSAEKVHDAQAILLAALASVKESQ